MTILLGLVINSSVFGQDNKKYPVWKVLVTENGYVRKTISFSQQIANVLKEYEQEKRFLPSVGMTNTLGIRRFLSLIGYNPSLRAMQETPLLLGSTSNV